MFRPKAPKSPEAALLDHIVRPRKCLDGLRAAYIHLSDLRPYSRQDYRLYIAKSAFDGLKEDAETEIYGLFNDDVVVFCTDETAARIEDAILHLRFLFSEDPLLKDDADGQRRFCTWFDLSRDHETLQALARGLIAAAESYKSRAASSVECAPHLPSVKSLDPPNLTILQEAIALADISTLIRRQPVCAVVRGTEPRAIFNELYTSIELLRQSMVPNVDLHANRWLFQALTELLDARVIEYLAEDDDPALRRPFSLNMHVSSLLTPEFMKLGERLRARMDGNIVIELQLIDVYSDLGNFLFARDYFRERGFKFCLDGITHLSLPLIDREGLGFDLVKLFWRADFHEQLTGASRDQLRRATEKAGVDRLILAHCDSKQALEIGRGLGIALYQGRLIDEMLHQADASVEATTRPRAARG